MRVGESTNFPQCKLKDEGNIMKKIAILLAAATLLFVGCEKKEEGQATEGKKTTKSTKAATKDVKIGTYDLTISIPENAEVKAGIIGGYDISYDGIRINVKPGSTLVPMKKTLDAAKAKAEKDLYTDVKGEEITNGYYFTGIESKAWKVKARIDKGGKTFEAYTFGSTAVNMDNQAKAIAAIKTIK